MCKLRGKNLTVKPARTGRYHTPPGAARTIAALLALRGQVIAPILAGIRSPRRGRKPAHWTAIDRDYETLRIGMQALFYDLGITPIPAPRYIDNILSMGEMQAASATLARTGRAPPRRGVAARLEICWSESWGRLNLKSSIILNTTALVQRYVRLDATWRMKSL